jgi:hypothetical protein
VIAATVEQSRFSRSVRTEKGCVSDMQALAQTLLLHLADCSDSLQCFKPAAYVQCVCLSMLLCTFVMGVDLRRCSGPVM